MTHGTGARILVVEDDPGILRALKTNLTRHGFDVETAETGGQALETYSRYHPDLLLLDLGLPDVDGTFVIQQVRAQGGTPIVVLSVRGAEHDKVEALDLGADDYLTKPFGVDELLARVRALLRRTRPKESEAPRFEADGVAIDLGTNRVSRDGTDVHLTRTEWALLEAMAEHPGKLLTHRWLLERVWGLGYEEDVEVLRVFVSQLRRKIEPDPTRPALVLTEPGVGYRWAATPGSKEGAGGDAAEV